MNGIDETFPDKEKVIPSPFYLSSDLGWVFSLSNYLWSELYDGAQTVLPDLT